MSATTSPALPAFSYAQAAKGLAPSTSSHVATEPNSATTESSLKERKPRPGEITRSENESESVPTKNEDSTNTSVPHATQSTPGSAPATRDPVNKENVPPPKIHGSSNDEAKGRTSGTSSPSFGADSTSTLPKEDEISFHANDASDAWERQSQVSTSVEKSTQMSNGSKGKDPEDDWEKVSVSKAPVEKELKAAPIPAVNIWQARKEAQAAKAKAIAAQRPAPVVTTNIKPKVSSPTTTEAPKVLEEESKRKPTVKPSANGDKDEGISKRKQSETPKGREDGKNTTISHA